MANLQKEIPDLGQLVHEHLILVSIRPYTCAMTTRLFLLATLATVLLAEDFFRQGRRYQRRRHHPRAARRSGRGGPALGNGTPEGGQPWGTRAKQVHRRPHVRQDRDRPRVRHRSLQAHGRRNHSARWPAPESGTDAKLALKFLHT